MPCSSFTQRTTVSSAPSADVLITWMVCPGQDGVSFPYPKSLVFSLLPFLGSMRPVSCTIFLKRTLKSGFWAGPPFSLRSLNRKPGSRAFGASSTNLGCSAGSLSPAAAGTPKAFRGKNLNGSIMPAPPMADAFRNCLLVSCIFLKPIVFLLVFSNVSRPL